MADENQNMIPDKYDRLILRVGQSVTAVMGTVAAVLKASGGTVPLWLLILVGAIPAGLVLFSFGGNR